MTATKAVHNGTRSARLAARCIAIHEADDQHLSAQLAEALSQARRAAEQLDLASKQSGEKDEELKVRSPATVVA